MFRNGQPLDESYVNQKCKGARRPDRLGQEKTYPVPNGEVFVMGDNRCDSEDSRSSATCRPATIIGRAFLIIWPFGRIHSLS